MEGWIYKYENKINHKVYVGQTTDLSNRKTSHRYKATFDKTKFYNAVRKYGWENFDYDILTQISADNLEELKNKLDELEEFYVKEYDSFHNGYNSTAGGHCYRGKTVSEEFREFCKNRTYSEETRRKMSEAARRRKISEETREKLRKRECCKRFGEHGEKYAKKRDAARKKAIAKSVVQIDAEGKIINEFEALKDAARYMKENIAIDKSLQGLEKGIYRHCHGLTKKKFYYGFEWKFKANV